MNYLAPIMLPRCRAVFWAKTLALRPDIAVVLGWSGPHHSCAGFRELTGGHFAMLIAGGGVWRGIFAGKVARGRGAPGLSWR